MGTSEGNEDVFHALQEFTETPKGQRQMSPVLEDALENIAKTGELFYSWGLVHPVIEHKLQCTFQEFFESTSYPNRDEAEREHAEMKEVIFSRLGWFDRAPFTVQRLCELVMWPKRHYTRCDKYMRGLTKVVKVVSTIGPPICNGSSHSLVPENCNGNGNGGTSSPLGARRENVSTNGEPSNIHQGNASVSSAEPDDSFSSFSLSPRQMPSPYSPPLSPTGFENRTAEEAAVWHSPTGSNDPDSLTSTQSPVDTTMRDEDASPSRCADTGEDDDDDDDDDDGGGGDNSPPAPDDDGDSVGATSPPPSDEAVLQEGGHNPSDAASDENMEGSADGEGTLTTKTSGADSPPNESSPHSPGGTV